MVLVVDTSIGGPRVARTIDAISKLWAHVMSGLAVGQVMTLRRNPQVELTADRECSVRSISPSV